MTDDATEAALVAQLEARRDFDDKLEMETASWVLDQLEGRGSMQDVANFRHAWEQLATARLALEDWDDDEDGARGSLLERLEQLRPTALADEWSPRVSARRLQDGARLTELNEPGLRGFLAPSGTYELRLADGLLVVRLAETHGSLFLDDAGRYSEAVSPDAPDVDVELPDFDGRSVFTVPRESCIPRPLVCDLVVQACAANLAGALSLDWVPL